jgi:hypothetical chaperone protein
MDIIRHSAALVGFDDINFMLEPEAAGYEFAQNLQADTVVLVVDIGGGTSDFSVLKIMANGESIALSHSGIRIGGNDLDIALAMHRIMEKFGKGEDNRVGRPLPFRLFWDAIAINDIPAQRRFYSQETKAQINNLMCDVSTDSAFRRFPNVWENKRGFELVRLAELGKIALSSETQTTIEVDEVGSVDLSRDDWWMASARVLATVEKQLLQAIASAKEQPEIVYVTGGSAISPMFREKLQVWLPNLELRSGNSMKGVVSGLAMAAESRI